MNTTVATRKRLGRTVEAFRELVIDNLFHTHGQAIQTASKHDAYMALSYAVRDYLIERWRRTNEVYYEANPKVVCYLSAEYLLGKQLPQNLLYSGTMEVAKTAVAEAGLDLEEFLHVARFEPAVDLLGDPFDGGWFAEAHLPGMASAQLELELAQALLTLGDFAQQRA